MSELKILYRKDPTYGACPDCGVRGSMKKSRARSFFEAMVKKITPYVYYRCVSCGWRGPLRTVRLTKNSFKTIFYYLFVMIVSAIAIIVILSRVT